MTTRQMQYAFEEEAARFDSDIMLESHIIFYWLNESQDRYYKTRYSGFNSKREGFGQSQKRMDDLRTLVVDTNIATTINDSRPNTYDATYPSDYVLTVGEEANITFTYNSIETTDRVAVYPITSDAYTKEVNSPFGKHILHYEKANPLRLTSGEGAQLISDGNYTIDNYILRYLKQPISLSVDGADCELPEHAHTEIVSDAVKLLLENLGDERYQSNKSESLEQE